MTGGAASPGPPARRTRTGQPSLIPALSRRLLPAAVGALMLLVAGCGARSPGQTGALSARQQPAHTRSAAEAPEGARLPVRVPDSRPCSSVTRPATPASAEDLLTVKLPCLTSTRRLSLADLRGPVLVNLWASWCGPCRTEMPVLAAASQRYSERVAFVGVNTRDSPQMAGAFLTQLRVRYPQLVDTNGRLLADLRIPGLPVTLLLDRRGRVVSQHVGPLTPQDLTGFLTPVLP